MVTEFNVLVTQCREELEVREYDFKFQASILLEWECLKAWLESHGYLEFSEDVGIQYCDEKIGGHLILEGMSHKDKRRLRAVRMLISYQKGGDFEFRSPSVERIFADGLGSLFNDYLSYLEDVRQLAPPTIRNKLFYLYDLYRYLEDLGMNLSDISVGLMEEFFCFKSYTPAARHNANSAIKLFLQHVYNSGKTQQDLSICILPDSYNRHSKIPTTYTEKEIRSAIATVERSSGIGKRDYLILLLASEYGWRAKDITGFCFDEIDWEKNVIRFEQHKTGAAVEFPLLSSVGNAIIDYMKNGRPDSNCPNIILAGESSKWNNPLSSSTIHSIVTKYLRKANVPNWQTKKHGSHSWRHSLATNMLKKNISLPVISTVLGHQTTATTKVYLKVDVEKLRMCPLPMPKLFSPHYKEVG